MASFGNGSGYNGTGVESSGVPTQFEVYFAAVITIIVIIAAVVGNILVFCAFIRFKKLRNPTNYFIVNLAATDFLIGLLPAPLWACLLLTGKPSRDQDAFYRLWEILDVVCGFGSIMSLTFIAIDRYICIKDALRYYAVVTAERVAFCLLFIWVYSLIAGLLAFLKPYIAGPDQWFRYYTFSAGYIVPLLIMAFCYINIYQETLRLNKQQRQLLTLGAFVNENPQEPGNEKENEKQDAHNATATQPFAEKMINVSRCNSAYEADKFGGRNQESHYNDSNYEHSAATQKISDMELQSSPADTYSNGSMSKAQLNNEKPGNKSRESIDIGWGVRSSNKTKAKMQISSNHTANTKKLQRKEDELKAAKTLSFILGAYLLTWTPFIAALMIYEWNRDLLTLRLTYAVKCLHYSNSGFNPFLYTLLNKHFRTAFIKLLRRQPK